MLANMFFPDGKDKEILSNRISVKNRLRLVFDGKSAYEPIISRMIMELNAPVNFLYANMEVVGDQQKGQMVICLSEDPVTAEKQKQFLIKEEVEFTEIEEEVE